MGADRLDLDHITRELARRRGHQQLPAVSGGGHARGAVHLEPNTSCLVALDIADMQAHPYLQLADRRRPPMSPQAAERGDRGSGASARLVESGEESVALGPLDVAALSGDRAADDTVMLCQNVWPCPLKLGRQPRRALDVSEQQRDRAHR